MPLIRNLVDEPDRQEGAANSCWRGKSSAGRSWRRRRCRRTVPPCCAAAFAATLRDPEFLKDAERSKLDTDLVTGEEVDAVLKKPPTRRADVIERVKQALDRK